MKMMMVVVAAAACLGVSQANAENWVRVGSDEETEHYVDEASLARDGEIVRVAKRAVYREPQPIGGTAGMPLIVESTGVVEADCTRNQHRVVSIRLISDDQKVMWSSGEMKRVWETIEPGSPGQATLDFVCARTASR